MFLKNTFSNRHFITKLIGGAIRNDTGYYIEIDEKTLKWCIKPNKYWFYRENPVLSTIEDVENLIKSKERIKKLKSL